MAITITAGTATETNTSTDVTRDSRVILGKDLQTKKTLTFVTGSATFFSTSGNNLIVSIPDGGTQTVAFYFDETPGDDLKDLSFYARSLLSFDTAAGDLPGNNSMRASMGVQINEGLSPDSVVSPIVSTGTVTTDEGNLLAGGAIEKPTGSPGGSDWVALANLRDNNSSDSSSTSTETDINFGDNELAPGQWVEAGWTRRHDSNNSDVVSKLFSSSAGYMFSDGDSGALAQNSGTVQHSRIMTSYRVIFEFERGGAGTETVAFGINRLMLDHMKAPIGFQAEEP